jgi:hypothetical protein
MALLLGVAWAEFGALRIGAACGLSALAIGAKILFIIGSFMKRTFHYLSLNPIVAKNRCHQLYTR